MFLSRQLVVVVGLVLSLGVCSALWNERIALAPSDGFTTDRFGFSIALSGDFMAVGSINDDNEYGTNAGSIYTYQWTSNNTFLTGSWKVSNKLVPAGLEAFAALGYDVSLSGSTLVGSAPMYNGSIGVVYVFTYNDTNAQWDTQQRILASDGALQDQFGYSIDLQGDTLAVGATGNSQAAMSAGACYLYTRDDETGVWSLLVKLMAQDASMNNAFGMAVALDATATQLVVGAPQRNSGRGGAYVYYKQNGAWVYQQILTAGDVVYGHFGGAVAVSGNRVAVGAPGPGSPNFPGAAYTFVTTNTSTAKLLRSSASISTPYKLENRFAPSGLFYLNNAPILYGSSLALDGATLAIGSHGDGSSLQPNSGSVFVYALSLFGSWLQDSVIKPADTGANQFFGYSIAMDCDVLAVGSPTVYSVGEAHVFTEGTFRSIRQWSCTLSK